MPYRKAGGDWVGRSCGGRQPNASWRARQQSPTVFYLRRANMAAQWLARACGYRLGVHQIKDSMEVSSRKAEKVGRGVQCAIRQMSASYFPLREGENRQLSVATVAHRIASLPLPYLCLYPDLH